MSNMWRVLTELICLRKRANLTLRKKDLENVQLNLMSLWSWSLKRWQHLKSSLWVIFWKFSITSIRHSYTSQLPITSEKFMNLCSTRVAFGRHFGSHFGKSLVSHKDDKPLKYHQKHIFQPQSWRQGRWPQLCAGASHFLKHFVLDSWTNVASDGTLQVAEGFSQIQNSNRTQWIGWQKKVVQSKKIDLELKERDWCFETLDRPYGQ